MVIETTLGQSFLRWGQFVLVAVLCFALTTTTHDSTAQPVSLKKTVMTPALESSAPAAPPVAQTEEQVFSVLSARDAALYRLAFAAVRKDRIKDMRFLLEQLSDTRLAGHVLAVALEQQGSAVTGEAYERWLHLYGSHPQAAAFYKAARAAGVKTVTNPIKQESRKHPIGTADFMPDLLKRQGSADRALARVVLNSLRQGTPEKARDAMIAARAKGTLYGTFSHEIEAVIAAAFFRFGERPQALALAQAASVAGQPLGLWIRGLIAFEIGDHDTGLRMFAQLAAHPALDSADRAAAHFWTYRTAARLKQGKKAQKHLQQAAKSANSFYGILARHMMEQSLADSVFASDLPFQAQHKAVLAADEGGWRALALLQVGEQALARAEFEKLLPQSHEALRQAVQLVAEAYQLSGLSLQRTSQAQVPLLPWKPSDGYKVDRALLFALARQESLFNPRAKSPRGAQGLMQIMPATAKGLVSDPKQQRAMDEQELLLDPTFSITLGQKYIMDLMRHPRIGHDIILLLAAYNAGPSKALRWMESRSRKDSLLFMESLPVRETRQYIAQVLPYYWAYSAQLGRAEPSITQMAQGQWPTPPLMEKQARRYAQAQ
ncbi:MAG: lytic transglycosylase domain-containing protein [Alphaproteobacteria bacterium]|nr:lytic transglycosylase domain-containing protein [Alphaproteobacteria bacterium]